MQWKILFTGDVYIDRDVRGCFMAPDLAEYLSQHDLAVCNFEGAMPAAGAEPIEKVGPAMAHVAEAMTDVRRAGFDVVSLANNHVYDFGDAGLKATLEACRSIVPVGAGLRWEDAYACRKVDLGDLTLGFLAFSEAQFGALLEPCGRGGYAWIGHAGVETVVKQARKEVDVLFVQCHAGVENIALPLPEWREKYRQLITWGADAVIAHHPHVPQGWETFEGKPICYSLGNFFFPAHAEGWGMSASLMFDGATFVQLEAKPVVCRDGLAAFEMQRMAELETRRDALAPGRYEELIERDLVRLWNEVYSRHYRFACSGFASHSWLRDLKRALLIPAREKQRRLLHNLQIESHLWAASRALRLMAGG
jgi:poly-gamma-glutamate synthesis protein (capsule biosynthesis protein)